MAMRPETCDPWRLDLFLRNCLPEELHPDIEAHLGVCPACRNKLDELAGGPRWWSEVRHYLGGDGASQTGSAWPAAKLKPAGADLSFLQPSDNNSSLGRLGPYEVLEVLGRGGMGVVLKAFDPALHRPVAIKVLAAEYAANGAARKRFAREAQAAAAVIHDHVVPVHAVDAEAAPPYLVMAFIAGRSLQQRIDESGPLESREILRIGMQTAAGLAAAHAQGLVHRDIKPANIMLENGIERVRITDFGLARAVDDVSVTQHGAVAGTPQYMAPEQARGENLDQRADLFSLGSMMYAMCTGRAPFRGDSGMAVLRQVCDIEPKAIRSINSDIPAWLEGIIRKLQAKDPADRFQSADEVANLLEGCLAHLQQPDRHSLPALAVELGRDVSGRGSMVTVGRRWWLAAGVALVIGVPGLILALRPGAGPAPDRSGDVAPEVIAPAPPAAVITLAWDDQFDREVSEARTRLRSLEQSMSWPGPSEWIGDDPAIAVLHRRAASLEHQLSGFAQPSNDPVEQQINDVRQRLEALKNSLGNGPN
jgi:eukaryotic-like serine/threonine-protein kinase